MPKRQRMAEEWNEFSRRAIPAEANANQRRVMRRAFYAGGQAILFRLIQAFAPETEPTTEDLQLMQDVYDELQTFLEEVKAGRA